MPLTFLAYITAEDDPTLLLYRAPGADGPNLVASVMDATTESTREEVRTEFAAQLRKWADRLDGIEQPGAAREELLRALGAIAAHDDLEAGHARADELLIAYIDDAEIAAAWEAIPRSYGW